MSLHATRRLAARVPLSSLSSSTHSAVGTAVAAAGVCGCRNGPHHHAGPLSSSSSSSSSSLAIAQRRRRGASEEDLLLPQQSLYVPSRAYSTTSTKLSVGPGKERNVNPFASHEHEQQQQQQQNTAKDGSAAYDPHQQRDAMKEKYPIIQFPSRSLWSAGHYGLNLEMVRNGDFADMLRVLREARSYYQYPSLCGPQIGWNVRAFTLFDNTFYINPVDVDREEWQQQVLAEAGGKPVDWVLAEEEHLAALRDAGKTAFAWEPCASCCFIMHYIERPLTVRLRYYDEHGVQKVEELDRMKARMALHEMDHLQGVLFMRRVVDANHVLPLEGFTLMSDWSDDFPSMEARSTFFYTLFRPPYHFISDDRITDANLLDRKFEDGIYPGWEREKQLQIENAAMKNVIKEKWGAEKDKTPSSPRESETS